MCTSGLPINLWGEALKTANYICNRSPSKSVETTPFELWCGRQPSLHHCHVWGCKAEAKIPDILAEKLGTKTLSCHFLGYCDKSKGYRFYTPQNKTQIYETSNAKFLDEVCFNSNFEDLTFEFDEMVEDEALVNVLPLTTDTVMADAFNPYHLQNPNIAATAVPEPQVENLVPNQQAENIVEPQLAEQQENLQNPQNLENQEAMVLGNGENVQPRRSTRQRKPVYGENSDFQVYLQEADMLAEDNDPLNFKQAQESKESSEWFKAMEDEIESMSKNKVWELVKPVEKQKAIGCKWVFKTKRDANGNIERHKARLVAKGFTQKEGIDYNETFSPVSTKDSFRIIMALVAHYNMELHQMDVKTAFLNGELDEVIYMKQPEGFIKSGKEDYVCKLKKSIYGLKQASRQWYKKFDSVISSFGFEENVVDECVYIKAAKNDFIFLILYVDDILLASSSMKLLKETKSFLSNNFDMKDLGEASYVLGIEIKRDRKLGILGLSQQNYIQKVLKRFGMETCTAGEAPMSKGDKLSKISKNGGKMTAMETKPYARLIGSLMYAQVCTRPDLAFSVGILSRFQTSPTQEHWIAGKKVLRYLQKTKSYMLVYRQVKNLELIGYSDSDFAGNYPKSKKSTSGYIFMLAGGAVAWKTMKQSIITTSTMQAEFVAVYECMCQGLWMRNFLIYTDVLKGLVSNPLKLFCDNEAAVFFSKNNKRSSNSKHIDLKYYDVRKRVKRGQISVLDIDTESQLADPFTKALSISCFQKHVKNMGISEDLYA